MGRAMHDTVHRASVHEKWQSLPLVHELTLPERAQTSAHSPSIAASQGRLQPQPALLQHPLLQRQANPSSLCQTIKSLSFWVVARLLVLVSVCLREYSPPNPVFPCLSECLRLRCSACGNSVSFGVEIFFVVVGSC